MPTQAMKTSGSGLQLLPTVRTKHEEVFQLYEATI